MDSTPTIDAALPLTQLPLYSSEDRTYQVPGPSLVDCYFWGSWTYSILARCVSPHERWNGKLVVRASSVSDGALQNHGVPRIWQRLDWLGISPGSIENIRLSYHTVMVAPVYIKQSVHEPECWALR